jgi:pantoate--beta-alanine ligase
MQTIQSINEMQSHAISLRSKGCLIALVPTMGCLHEGHLSLIDIAREKADKVIVSIFVNPAQFGPNEDFDRYPRVLEEDLELCRKKGVDIAFNPDISDIYPEGYSTYVEEGHVSTDLCGVSRPNHFRGVATVCLKLFNITRPDFAVFGQKDAQQCAVVKKMATDLNLPIEIVVGSTLRDVDGLATSSRNRYLTAMQRSDALTIPHALEEGKKLVEQGVRNVDRVVAEVTHHLSQCRRIRMLYVKVVDRETMESAREIEPGRHIIVLAAWVDQIRLIDNIDL